MSDKIIDRIKKLLALANNNSNVNEAALAAAEAQKLMLEHKIKSVDLEFKEEFEDRSIYESVNVVSWKATLLKVISEAYFCKTLIVTDSYTKNRAFRVLGKSGDIDVVNYLFQYLCNEIERLCKQSDGYGKAFANSFKVGAVETIYIRLQQQRTQSVNNMTSGNRALILKADADVQDFLNKRYSHVTKRSNKSNLNPSGYCAGVKAARSIDLGGEKSSLPNRQKLLT